MKAREFCPVGGLENICTVISELGPETQGALVTLLVRHECCPQIPFPPSS